ncbi:MAG: polysaccharide biosynthesis tyrosine autokinase [Mariprofundaceae bacterium]
MSQNDEHAESDDYIQYWNIIRPKIWIIIALSVAVTGLAAIVVGNMKPFFSSTAVIALEHQKERTVSIKDVYELNTREHRSEATGTEMAVLKSEKLLGKVAVQLKLDRNPSYNPNLAKPESSTGISGLLSVFGHEKKILTQREVKSLIIKRLKKSLELTEVKNTRVINITFEAVTPELAAKLANSLAETYIQDNIDFRKAATNEATEWMSKRADTLKKKLEMAQQKLQQFIEKEKLVDVGGVAGLTQIELTDLTNRMVESRVKLADLNRTYGQKHPMVISAQSELSRARSALAAKKKEIRSIGRKQVKLETLKQDVKSANTLYEKFFNRMNETREAATRTRANARIIESGSVNPIPVRPHKGKLIMAAFLGSLLLGAMLVLMLDMLDASIRSVEHVEKRLGLSMLGLLPRIQLKGKSLLDVVTNDKRNMFNESMRTIRTGIMLSALDNPHKVLLVTSSVPGEGKSTVAANLAMNLGKMEKVLLIDCDFRRPSVAKAFGLSTSAAGMSELVAGTAKFKDCINQSKKYDIDIFTAGTIPPNPLELLSSDRFAKLIAVLESHYDRIIVDAPPVHAVSDALVLSKHAKGMLFVVKADSTSHRVIKPCIKRLQEVDAPIIGVILNQVDVDKKGSYGYGYGGYYDQYGYGSGAKV